MTCLFHLQTEPLRFLGGFNDLYVHIRLTFFFFAACYWRSVPVNLDYRPVVNIGSGCEDSPLQHGGFWAFGQAQH